MVGALWYLTITRPDLAHAVNSISQYMQSPILDHFQAVKHILCYVKGTLHYGLSFSPSLPTGNQAYSDADWASFLDTRHSTFGYAIFFASKVTWLSHLLRDLKVSLNHRPLVLCDNKNAISLTLNLVSHKRAKHIDLDYHFVRELATSGAIQPQYVLSHL
ncbi:hypothetical protein F2P56_037088 [Juglans regia]|uniref:Secreted RxLR effector protein 161-like n=1 Tax=Juglans regia TaxID=51240 RepID=A0A833TUU3_JUGRE|nr:hypothetical protein F2P56_037088 [Juglans regia]